MKTVQRILTLVVLLLLLAATFSTTAANLEKVQVTRIISGDAIEVKFPDGRLEKVKYIGMKAPEASGETEPFGEKSFSYNKALVFDRTVWLEYDVERRDEHDRLLAYVYLDPNRAVMVNSILIVQGFARVIIYPPNVRHAEMFGKLQQGARADERGIWSEPEEAESRKEEVETRESASPPVVIACIHFDATGNDHGNENGEWVVLEASRDTTLTGWSIYDEAGNRYFFPDGFALKEGETVRIYTGAEDKPKKDTGCFQNPDYELFWRSTRGAIWNNGGDTAFLSRGDEIAASCSYPGDGEQVMCVPENS